MISACAACGWSGVPTYEGGIVVRRPRYVTTPQGKVEQVPGKKRGSKPSPICPACKCETVAPVPGQEYGDR